jgi:hypothetical protein
VKAISSRWSRIYKVEAHQISNRTNSCHISLLEETTWSLKPLFGIMYLSLCIA